MASPQNPDPQHEAKGTARPAAPRSRHGPRKTAAHQSVAAPPDLLRGNASRHARARGLTHARARASASARCSRTMSSAMWRNFTESACRTGRSRGAEDGGGVVKTEPSRLGQSRHPKSRVGDVDRRGRWVRALRRPSTTAMRSSSVVRVPHSGAEHPNPPRIARKRHAASKDPRGACATTVQLQQLASRERGLGPGGSAAHVGPTRRQDAGAGCDLSDGQLA